MRRWLFPLSLTLLLPACEPAVNSESLAVAGQPDLECTWAEVIDVTDGDTFDVRIDGRRDTVRLFGVDAPELRHPTRGEDPFGPEATNFMVEAIDAPVCLEAGITERDDFDRLLRYAWLPDGRMLNEELLREGLAVISTFPPDVRYVESRYLAAQDEARTAARGIWSLVPAGSCDPAYPGVCIPPPPPDLDCGDIEFRRFTVLAPDPHRFDSDGNGVGCEG